jgi:hypothetical protein
MTTLHPSEDLSKLATVRDWAVRYNYQPYALALDLETDDTVEIISWPWWEDGALHLNVRVPNDPTTLRTVANPQLTITPHRPMTIEGQQLRQQRRHMPADVATWAFTRQWMVEQTGGGCTALHLFDYENEDGYWWITDEDGSQAPQSWGRCYLGRYDRSGEQVGGWHFETLQRADAFVTETTGQGVDS